MPRSTAAATLIATTLALATGAAGAASVTATVAAIDPATGALTVRAAQGREITLNAAQGVKNLAEVKVGDQVDVEYVEASALAFRPLGESVTATRDSPAAGQPAGAEGRKMTLTGVVVAADEATQTVTLRAAQRTLELKVSDPEQFRLAAKGSQVEATYTEATAVTVRTIAPK
jgi:ribosomal 50S subunit-recycling heat shock protein